ncbi:MAG: TRAP transporter substrate-binding protein [Synergistales bacterium]
MKSCRWFSRIVGALLFVSLLAAGSAFVPGAAEAVTKLRMGHEMPENHPYHIGSVKFGDILKQKTGGRIEVVVYPNGQLGNQKQLAEMVAAGQLDLCLVWQGIMESYDKNTGVVSLPFIFDSWKHTWKVVDGPVGQEIFKPLEAKNIKVVTVFNNGLYNVVSRVPIKSPADMKGIKLRVQPSAVFVETGQMMGSVVTPMAFGEVYSALQLGAIDAQIQGPINVRKSKHFEVAKYTCQNEISFLLEPMLMNAKSFYALSKEDQKAVLDAAHEAAVWQRKFAEEEEVRDTVFLKANGMQYYKADKNQWRAATMPMYDKHPEWKGMVKKINDLKK